MAYLSLREVAESPWELGRHTRSDTKRGRGGEFATQAVLHLSLFEVSMVVTSRTNKMPAPAPGQIWKDGDPRDNRYVIVVATYPDKAFVRRVYVDGAPWPKSRSVPTRLSRFRGQRSGYSFVRLSAHGTA